jgi:hypothetical protein
MRRKNNFLALGKKYVFVFHGYTLSPGEFSSGLLFLLLCAHAVSYKVNL